MRNPKTSQLRIIGGEFRSRLVTFIDTDQIRPTPNRVRETLFNWLQTSIVGARCLDVFSGSGALAFEALSRGAAAVVAIEKDTAFVQQLQQNAQKLASNKLQILNQDFFNAIETQLAGQQFDIIFLDPPFHQGLLLKALAMILAKNLLAPGGMVYFEVEKTADFALPDNFSFIKDQIAGQVRYGLLTVKSQNYSANLTKT